MTRIIKKYPISESEYGLYCEDTKQAIPADPNNSDYIAIQAEIVANTAIITPGYAYSLDDFAYDCVNPETLLVEIEAKEGIDVTVSHAIPYALKCEIFFEATLSGPEKTKLDEVVAAHDGR